MASSNYGSVSESGTLRANRAMDGGRNGGGRNNDGDEEFHPLLLSGDTQEGPNRSQAHNATTDQDIVLSQKGAGETVITDITHSKYGDDDLEPLSQSYADPDDNYVHLLGFKIPKLWRVLWGSGEEDKKISNCDTIFHLLKGNIGTGILAMPDAMKNSGLAVGTVGLVVLSVICVHCMHLLVKANQRLKSIGRFPQGKNVLTYADVMELTIKESPWQPLRACSSFARTLITIFLCLTQFGFCCVYFVFVAQNLQLVVDHHFGPRDYHFYMAIVLPAVLVLCSVKELKSLAPVSVLANFLQLVALGLIFFYLAEDLPPTWDRKLAADLSQLPLFFGTAIYAFEGIGIVLPVENQMATPHDLRGWNGVLNTSMVIVSCLYIAVGFFGYLQYGENVLGSVTLNLPVDEWLAQIIIVLFATAIFLSYAIQFYVPLEILLPAAKARFPRHETLVDYGLRYAFVLVTFGMAAAIPRLDIFISLVGALSSSTLALLAPPLIDSVLFWEERKSSGKMLLLKNAAIFTVGFAGFVTGTYYSLVNVVNYFRT